MPPSTHCRFPRKLVLPGMSFPAMSSAALPGHSCGITGRRESGLGKPSTRWRRATENHGRLSANASPWPSWANWKSARASSTKQPHCLPARWNCWRRSTSVSPEEVGPSMGLATSPGHEATMSEPLSCSGTHRGVRNLREIAFTLAEIAGTLAALGRYEQAGKLFGASEAYHERIAYPFAARASAFARIWPIRALGHHAPGTQDCRQVGTCTRGPGGPSTGRRA